MKHVIIVDGVRYVPEVNPLEEVKAAFLAGKPCQNRIRHPDAEWHDMSPNSNFSGWHWNNETHEWRIKPEPKPDAIHYDFVRIDGMSLELAIHAARRWDKTSVLKLTVDGETGKLKSAEVL